ncbi:MAG: GNAT family N-acetyltransferase [Marinibacterium sp.]|nr:GNAT family N-acetyltransferase [Marinibacterium sp.]
MTGITILPARDFSSSALCSAMNAAFSDYQVPTHLTVDAFDAMMIQRGHDATVSKVALLNGDIAAIWLMGVRGSAAYLIVSGTRPEHRGRGLSSALAGAVLDQLRAARIATFQTEVLQSNSIAQRLYARIGMEQNRRLGCSALTRQIAPGPTGMGMGADLTEQPWPDIAPQVGGLRDWAPSWQHSDAPLTAAGADGTCICATRAGDLLGYVAMLSRTRTVAQIAVAPKARRCGIGRALMAAAQRHGAGGALRVINYDADDRGFAAYLRACGAEPIEGQFELIMPLHPHP